MSDTEHAPDVEHTPEDAGDKEWPVTLAAFAKTLQPKMVQVPSTSKPGTMTQKMVPGEPDEIWVKWLNIAHGRERHTIAGWKALIETYKTHPAGG